MTGITQYIPLPTARMAVFTPGQNASPGRGLLSLKTLAVHASKANSPGSFHHAAGREWLQLVRRGIGGFVIWEDSGFCISKPARFQKYKGLRQRSETVAPVITAAHTP